MVIIHENMDRMIKICLWIQTKIKKAKLNSRKWTARWSSGAQLEAKFGGEEYVVNMENRTCTCY
jgi:hypothetical protein